VAGRSYDAESRMRIAGPLLPVEYRDLFGTEIVEVFKERIESTRRRGRIAVSALAARELANLLRIAWTERRLQRERRGDYLSQLDRPAPLLLRQMQYAIAHHDFVQARKCALRLDPI
jgi:hypothetical protein